MTEFLNASDVARETGYADGPAFLRARFRLERDHAFPRPMPTCLRPMKWRADQVRAWVAEQGMATLPDLTHAGPDVILMSEARRA